MLIFPVKIKAPFVAGNRDMIPGSIWKLPFYTESYTFHGLVAMAVKAIGDHGNRQMWGSRNRIQGRSLHGEMLSKI